MQNRSVVPEKVIKVYEQNEYLAHYVAYNAHDPSKSIVLPPGYKLLGPHTPLDGLVYYILECPTHNAERDIHIIFRGTKDLSSLVRDFEPKAPGSSSILLAANDIHHELHKSIRKLIEESELPVSITLTGHSLGASDSQNYFADLIKLINDWSEDDVIEDKDFYFQNISRLRLVAFNSPGVTQALANKVAYYTTKLFQKNSNFQIECYWLLVAGDIVQQFGETSVLADYLQHLIEIHLIKVTLKNPNIFKFDNHRTHVFNENAYANHNYEYFTNVNHALIVSQKLKNKHSFFQINAVEFCKYFIYHSTYYFNLLKNGTFKPTVKDINSLAHEPWVDVKSILEKDKIMRRTRRNSVEVHPLFDDENSSSSIFNKILDNYIALNKHEVNSLPADRSCEEKQYRILTTWNRITALTPRFMFSYSNFFAFKPKSTAVISEIKNQPSNNKPANN